MKAIAFLRVSTREQELGLEAQRHDVEKYARANWIEIVAWHSEIISGGAPLEERTGLQNAIADLEILGAEMLIASKWDRLSRSPTVGVMIEEMVKRTGGTIVAADGAGNGSDPAAELFRGMLLLFGQFERRMIGVRTKAALRAKKARGEFLGRPPRGYTIEAGKLVKLPPEPGASGYDWTAVSNARRESRRAAVARASRSADARKRDALARNHWAASIVPGAS